MRALFIVDTPHETNLPPMADIQYVDQSGELAGGYWIAPDTEAPQPNTIAVIVDSTDEMLDAMAANPKYLYLQEVTDEA